jgi:peptidoglycan-N-acetylglucosamine deacetylase
MRRSLWIKLPTIALAALAVYAVDGAWGVLAAVLVFALGTAVLMALVLHPNSSAWARTLWGAPRPTDAVALTFDDGPHPEHTLEIARVLAERGVRAAFFVVGEQAREHPEIIARLHADGHLVCNHSHTHAMTFHFSLWDTLRREVRACNRAVADVIGVEPALFRAPQGIKNPALGDVLRELEMTPIGWTARGLDSMTDQAEKVVERVLRDVAPGGVVLLHDGDCGGGLQGRSHTVEALPRILDGLEARGLRVVRLDELLEREPYRPVAA